MQALRNIWFLALATCTEGIRHKALWAIVCLAILLTMANVGVATLFSWDLGKVSVEFGLSAVAFTGLLLVFFLGMKILADDLERSRIFMLLSRPVSIWQYLTGKFFGTGHDPAADHHYSWDLCHPVHALCTVAISRLCAAQFLLAHLYHGTCLPVDEPGGGTGRQCSLFQLCQPALYCPVAGGICLSGRPEHGAAATGGGGKPPCRSADWSGKSGYCPFLDLS